VIQVTGLYPSKTGVIFDSPTLRIEFHGIPLGGLAIDVTALNAEGNMVGTLGFFVNRGELVYDPQISDPYDSLVMALQQNIIQQMQVNNPYNATFAIL